MQPQEIKKRFRLLTFGLIGVGLISFATLGFYLFKEFKAVPETDPDVRIVSNMSLTAQNLTDIFTPMNTGDDPNDIKQIYYSWYVHASGAWALDAYGAKADGTQMSRTIRLTIPANVATVKWKSLEMPAALGNRRGHIKHALASDLIGQDVVIATYAAISFTPSTEYYPGTSLRYFDLRSTNPIMSNPAPPFTFTCTICDNR
jgi:hypothetical protein